VRAAAKPAHAEALRGADGDIGAELRRARANSVRARRSVRDDLKRARGVRGGKEFLDVWIDPWCSDTARARERANSAGWNAR